MLHETLCSFSEAARRLPGGPVHISTVHRWRLRGVNGVKLESVVVGGRRMTSHEAIERFIRATTAAADGVCPNAASSRRERQIQAAEQALDDAGI